MQQHQRRDIQDWLDLFEQHKADSLRWRFVASSRLTFKPTIPDAVISGYSEQIVSSFRLSVKSRRLNPTPKQWAANFSCNLETLCLSTSPLMRQC